MLYYKTFALIIASDCYPPHPLNQKKKKEKEKSTCTLERGREREERKGKKEKEKHQQIPRSNVDTDTQVAAKTSINFCMLLQEELTKIEFKTQP